MNIIEAIKSGKNFKRKNKPHFLLNKRGSSGPFSLEDILAEDWEVEEETVKVTKSQVVEAIQKGVPQGPLLVVETVLKELGFEEE